MIKKTISFLVNLIRSETPESSKRFLAIYSTLFLQTFVVVKYTTPENSTWMLMELVGFVLVLVGVATWERKNLK
jgi:sensor histidine kinase YesM